MRGAVLGLLVGFLSFAVPANAELVERGDLFVRFAGGLTPVALPRATRAPIRVSMRGTIKTLSGERPPALRRISIELSRGGVLDGRGLPICHMRDLVSTANRQALSNCGGALVGTGSYLANTAFPEQLAFPAAGRILAFNARVGGRPAVLAHVYGTEPVAMTRVIVFRIRRRRGAFATVLSGDLPPSLNRYGYVRRIELSFFRRFSYRGRQRSYLSASCPAPAGFPGAVFPFARASMGFADGRTLRSTLTRSCRVRDSGDLKRRRSPPSPEGRGRPRSRASRGGGSG